MRSSRPSGRAAPAASPGAQLASQGFRDELVAPLVGVNVVHVERLGVRGEELFAQVDERRARLGGPAPTDVLVATEDVAAVGLAERPLGRVVASQSLVAAGQQVPGFGPTGLRRAFRIGQKQRVQVHKFLCVGTLEEKIDEMIERKKQVAEAVVGTGEGWPTQLSTAELKELIALRPGAVSEE